MADKTCPIHFISYPEQLDECPYCVEVRREEAAKPRPPEAPTSGEDQTALLAGIDALAEAAPVVTPFAAAGTDIVVPTFDRPPGSAPDGETVVLEATLVETIAEPAAEIADTADAAKSAARRPAGRRRRPAEARRPPGAASSRARSGRGARA